MVPTHYREELYCPCCKSFVTLLTPPQHNTSIKTFPRTSDDMSERDHKEPIEDPGMELVYPKAQTLDLFTQHTSRPGARTVPRAFMSEGLGL